MREQWLSQPLWLSFHSFSELGKLSYLIWKSRFRVMRWYENFEFYPTNSYNSSMISWCAGVYHTPSTSWSITLQPLGVYQASIPHLKGDIHSFDLRHSSLIWVQSFVPAACHLPNIAGSICFWFWNASQVFQKYTYPLVIGSCQQFFQMPAGFEVRDLHELPDIDDGKYKCLIR